MPKVYFDERIARTYDERSAEMFDPALLDRTVGFLADLAGDRAALEFAIGTGRVALPLSARGIQVCGIELSEPMAARLRAKPGADAVAVTIGDMATAKVDGSFRVVYLVFNTIMNLITQDAQVDCFANAAAHLAPDGCFVIEVGIPQLQRLPPGETVRAFEVTPHHLGFDEFEIATQIEYSHHYFISDDGRCEIFSAPYRYVWPSELDLMARLAGLQLRERWADWTRAPFTDDSRSHVSVWEKPA